MHNSASLSRRLRNRFASVGEIIQHCKKREFSHEGCLPSAGENIQRKTRVNYSFIYFYICLFTDQNFSCYVRCRCYFTTSNLAHLLHVSPDNPATTLQQSTMRSTRTKPHVMWIAYRDVYVGLHVEVMAFRHVGFLLTY